MHISKIRVQNYKAFYDSDWIEFEPGINIISGQNHSGKTALLEALSRNFENIPHKLLKQIHQSNPILDPESDRYSILTDFDSIHLARSVSSI